MSSSNDATDRGPWPEPDEPAIQPVVVDTSEPGGTWDVRDGWSGDAGSPDVAGSKGVSLAVAGLNIVFLLALPVLIVVGIYTYITVYALVKAIDSGPDSPDAGVVLIGVIGLVTLFVVLLGVGLWAIGRAADPKKRRH